LNAPQNPAPGATGDLETGAQPGHAPQPGPAADAGPVIARIPYLNSEPFYARWDEAPGPTIDLPPRALGQEARNGRADAGLMAAADWFRLETRFERVADFGISCRGEVRSVLLFSRRPVTELSGATVDLTTESSTSVALTRILLAARYGARDVHWQRRAVEGAEAPAGDAWLLIGDAALRAREAWRQAKHGGIAGTHLLDLGRAWFEWTGLPFVYAVWAVRSALPAAEKERLARFLDASLAAGEADLAGIARAHAGRGLGDARELTDYLAAFRYRLGPDEEHALACFRALCEEHVPGE
jgi:chorismate dehydratase